MLKSTAHSVSYPLSLLFNQSISFGTFPSEWKCSHITPILKSTSPSSSSCYRPISFLSLVSKVFEKHISLWIHNFCSQNSILSDSSVFTQVLVLNPLSSPQLICSTRPLIPPLLSVLSSLILAKLFIPFLILPCWTLFPLFISLLSYSTGFSLI